MPRSSKAPHTLPMIPLQVSDLPLEYLTLQSLKYRRPDRLCVAHIIDVLRCSHHIHIEGNR